MSIFTKHNNSRSKYLASLSMGDVAYLAYPSVFTCTEKIHLEAIYELRRRIHAMRKAGRTVSRTEARRLAGGHIWRAVFDGTSDVLRTALNNSETARRLFATHNVMDLVWGDEQPAAKATKRGGIDPYYPRPKNSLVDIAD
ncbi:MAG: hypothetical protein M3036_04055 [Bifidobacteriales bacterium]|nr:hypothetical protein [Bifidobacteriales bacterium]